MRKIILVVICMAFTVCSRAQIDSHYLHPSDTPTDADTISSVWQVPLAMGSSKMSGALTYSNDTIYYRGCYFKSITSTDWYLYDTVTIHPLSAGIYYFITSISVSPSELDTYCELPPQALQTRNYDTVITVTKYTGITQASGTQLQSVLLNSKLMQLHAPYTGTASIRVFDAAGRQCYAAQRQVTEGKNEIALDMPELLNGLYLYHIQLGEQRRVLKYVKQ